MGRERKTNKGTVLFNNFANLGSLTSLLKEEKTVLPALNRDSSREEEEVFLPFGPLEDNYFLILLYTHNGWN